MANIDRQVCGKCGKLLACGKNFYKNHDGTYTDICKKCLTMHIDPFNPDTFLWILKKLNLPYVEMAWKETVNRDFEKNPNKANGPAIFGHYIAKTKLNQWHGASWADSEKLAEEMFGIKARQEQEKNQFNEDLKQQFDEGVISEDQYKALTQTSDNYAEEFYQKQKEKAEAAAQDAVGFNNQFNENNFIALDLELPNPSDDLTDEDKVYLAMKWGKMYSVDEWIELEKKYEEMMRSFTIQDSDTMSTLILICKTYLKMNKAIDMGDYQSYQQLSRVYDSMRKSAKFTALQNKDGKNGEFNSIGELVAKCERDKGFIPRFATDIPQDKIDITIRDMNTYLKKLVTQDLGFGAQIEDAIKKLQLQQEMREQDAKEFLDDPVEEDFSMEDYEEFFNEVEEQRKQDFEGEEEGVED